MRTPKRDISPSGRRSWMRRHPYHAAYATWQFSLRNMYRDMHEQMVVGMRLVAEEYKLFDEMPVS